MAGYEGPGVYRGRDGGVYHVVGLTVVVSDDKPWLRTGWREENFEVVFQPISRSDVACGTIDGKEMVVEYWRSSLDFFNDRMGCVRQQGDDDEWVTELVELNHLDVMGILMAFAREEERDGLSMAQAKTKTKIEAAQMKLFPPRRK